MECVCSNFSLDSLVAGCNRGNLYLCDISCWSENSDYSHETRTRIIPAHEKAISSISCLPDNVTIVSTSEDGLLKFWNLLLGQILCEISPFDGLPISNCQVLYEIPFTT